MTSKTFISQVFRASLLISGTAIGAGMLGIPLMTYEAGFLPATLITFAVWLFMMATGFLLLEVTLWMEEGSNILSMSKRFLGIKGRALAGVIYLFLYYSLMVAYFSAGAPLLSFFLEEVFGVHLSNSLANFVFGMIFFSIIALGLKFVDRMNYLFMIGLILSFILLIGVGFADIKIDNFGPTNFGKSFLATPLLFGAFGYHNIIPSLTTYFKRNGRVMRHAIVIGTTIPLVVYLLWQWVIIGALPKELIQEAVENGASITHSLEELTHKPWIKITGQIFSFFAIVTSIMGVSFAMVDFIGDGLKIKRIGRSRILLCSFTFFPPFLLSSLNPSLFVTALSMAGGFGEALLNGILPIGMVWNGRYKKHLSSEYRLFGKKKMLLFLFCIALSVIGLEILTLI